MNLILTQSNQRDFNIRWEPFATSTPLKLMPSNANFEKNSQNQLKISTDSHDLIKKLQKDDSSANVTVKKTDELKQLLNKLLIKNKSCANHEFSSSSDEDDASVKRPVINLGLKSQTKSLLKNKKSKDQEVEVGRNKNAAENNEIVTCTERNKSGLKSTKSNYNHIHNRKKKKQDGVVNLDLGNLSSDEEYEVFDKVNSKILTNNTKLNLKREKNIKQHFQSRENLRNSRNCTFKTNKSKKPLGNKQKTSLDMVSETSENLQKLNFENKIIRKRKCKSIEQANNSLKIYESKKAKNRSVTPFKESRKNAVTPFYMLKNKTNISHQLFSESKEQELINTLDLTSDEVIQTDENKTNLLKNKLTFNSLNSSHPSNYRDIKDKQNEDKLRRVNIKKQHLTKNITNKLLPAADSEKQSSFQFEGNLKDFKESNENIKEPQKKTQGILKPCEYIIENNLEKNDLINEKTERKTEEKVGSKIRKGGKAFAVKRNANNIKISNNGVNNIRSSSDSVKNVCINEKSSEHTGFVGAETTTAEKQVFKLINELSYNECKTGCSAVECWNVNNFKCGVFRLKIKSEMNSRTLHSNSHLGGVLIKGNLRMKIGDKELDLQQGDMAFVPPLTDWQATNIGECESVFYYWCGRFKI